MSFDPLDAFVEVFNKTAAQAANEAVTSGLKEAGYVTIDMVWSLCLLVGGLPLASPQDLSRSVDHKYPCLRVMVLAA